MGMKKMFVNDYNMGGFPLSRLIPGGLWMYNQQSEIWGCLQMGEISSWICFLEDDKEV